MTISRPGDPAAVHRTGGFRTMLFVPGDSDKKVQKALKSGADAVIIDLEDSVSPSMKDDARRLACAMLGLERDCSVGVRVNGRDTDWYLDDLATVAAGAPDFIMLPKCSSVEDLRILDYQLAVLEAAHRIGRGRIGLVPLVTETAASLQGMDYRSAPERLLALCFAGEDLSADLGIDARHAEYRFNPLLAVGRQMTAIAAAAAGVPAIDTPFPDPRNEAGLIVETASAVELGFTGKLCIHPAQIAVVHDAFRPSAEQLAWATAVVAAFEASTDIGVALLDGKMIDKAHLRLARRRLQTASNANG